MNPRIKLVLPFKFLHYVFITYVHNRIKKTVTTIYGMCFVASEDVVCVLERITTVHGFCTSSKIYTESPKTKVGILSIVRCICTYCTSAFFSPRDKVCYGI